MNLETVLAFSIVAGVAIVSPGPAILLAVRNGAALGMRAVVWSSLGNVSGIFCLSAAAMLGLGVLLKSSAFLFGAVKLLGALYLFYIGARHLFGRASALGSPANGRMEAAAISPLRLYREAFLLAATNPKPILFFTALFPQFIDAQVPLLPQFFILTGIFMILSFFSLVGYALVAARARSLLYKPRFVKWVNRVVGAVFISFGAALLAMRRPAS
jgi:homoserine/homoserine lactone efflux protein